jgi:hypothetical protein
MRKLLAALLFVVSSFSYAQIVTVPIPGTPGLSITVGTGVNALPLQDIKNNPNAVNITTWDDWYNEVPLGFTFPMYGQNFTTSWAATNGYVTFRDPQTSGLGGGCCSGIDLRNTTDPRYNYTIYGLHTDLYSWNNQQQYYLREGNSMTYGWYNLSQCCSSQGGNSFEIKIDSTGLIDTRIAGAMVSWNNVTSGFSGDLSKGEYYQHYHGQGLNITPGGSSIFSWQALGGTGQSVDQCTINPLYNSSCPGYTEAYRTQQCSISALYDPSCPGYQQAYFNQQCSISSLYNQQCPGYEQAYLSQQCTANPLHSTSCPGYQQAYFNQQCSLSALYSPNCPGYEQANFNLQCSLNSLYSTSCPGYQTAYFAQQCTANPLYNSGCPGYQQAYFNQQCSLNTLYSPQCPGYAAAYQAYLTAQACRANSQSSPTCPGYVVTVASSTTTTTTTTTSSTSSATPQLVSDPVVNQTITTTSTSTAPTAPATAVQLTTTSSLQQNITTLAVESVQSTSSSSSSSDSSSSSSSSSSSTTTSSTTTTAATSTPRQTMQQARVEAARKEAISKGSEAVKESGEAKSINAQVATQGLVIAAMGFNPSFDAYNSVVMKDVSFYKPFAIYGGQKNIDNARVGRRLFGATDQLHNQMVQSQYELGK